MAPCCGGGCEADGAGLSRREFVAAVGAGAALVLGADFPAMAGPFVNEDFAKLIPADKKLRPEWVASLTARGEPETYRGRDLRYIGMPVGGLFCGTVYLGGDGRLWLWDIFNRNQLGAAPGAPHSAQYRGRTLSPGDGSAYVDPLVPDEHRGLEQGFTLRTRTAAGTVVRALDAMGFKDVSFTGEYPIGVVTYADPDCLVSVRLEAFSPFIPVRSAEDSSLPATIFSFRLTNRAAEAVEVELSGRLENAACSGAQAWEGMRRNEVAMADGVTTVLARVAPTAVEATDKPRPEIVYEDWGKETYTKWKAEGEAFGRGPVLRKEMPEYQGEVGGDTQRVVNSHATAPGNSVADKDAGTGKLTSTPFRIERRYIHFWIGGGNHAGKTCLNLVVDGKVARTATGKNDNRMALESFDVRGLEGKEAVLEIVDNEKGAWGNVGLGKIAFSDVAAKPAEPGEQADYGTMCLALCGAAAEIRGADSETPLQQKLVATLGRRVELKPGETRDVDFIIAWHFPNVGILGNAKRHYTAKFADARAVAVHVAGRFAELAGTTRLWRDTWYDSTLPYWFLNRTFANTSILATTTCHRFADGRFWAWEGVGCSPGTCTHVWHYAQAMGRLFPDVERDERERVDFGLALAPDGTIRFRAEFGATFAVDGQAGRILGAYREHQMSADDAFLRRVWPGVRKALMRLMAADPQRNGMLRGPLHNTLDADWFGYVPWLCGLYHAALRAGEEMAREVGDAETAATCRKILGVAAQNLDATCWKEEYGYYIHKGDASKPSEVGAYDGCHIDQVFGQNWAWQVGLGPVMTPAHVKAALKSLWTYNFTPDVGPWREAKKAGRWYAMAGDGGLIMVTYPFSTGRNFTGGGAWSAMYFNECMSGFEHQAAAHMVWEGMVQEGFAVTRAIHDRYHPRRRNPYNEVECSDHYARAMASYGTFLGACGYEYHGPKGHLGFAPRVTPEKFKAAFTAAEGWGTIAQTREGDVQREEIAVKWGKLRLRTLAFVLAEGKAAREVKVMVEGKVVAATVAMREGKGVVTLGAEVTLTKDQRVEVELRG